MQSHEPIQLGRKIVVWGVTGSGKTTLAKQLAAQLGLPRIELDALYWQPGWVGTPEEEFRARVQAAVDAGTDGWVLDGSYTRVSDIYLARADTLIWLHLPWRVSFWRLIKRTVKRAWNRESLYYEDGPRESWRMSFFSRQSILLWGISHHRSAQSHRAERLASLSASMLTYELRSAREIAGFLDRIAVNLASRS